MDEQSLGMYLRNLRKSYNYSQEFVASYLDISRQAYSHYETGRVIPPFDNCCKLAMLYNISPNNILNFTIRKDLADNQDMMYSTQNGLDEISDFIDYMTKNGNEKKYRLLSHRQKELLYYYDSMPEDTQEEIIEILKLKKRRLKL